MSDISGSSDNSLTFERTMRALRSVGNEEKAATTKSGLKSPLSTGIPKKQPSFEFRKKDAPKRKGQGRLRKHSVLNGQDNTDTKGGPDKANMQQEPSVRNKRSDGVLNIYVFGANDFVELGLGPIAGTQSVTQPRHNARLSALGIVQVASGGTHSTAITQNIKIFTWGSNENCALGRETAGGLPVTEKKSKGKIAEAQCKEMTPTEVDTDGVAEGTVFTQIAVGDNCTFALTEDGYVYGWGTFISAEGDQSFSKRVSVQKTPTLIPIKDTQKREILITKIECGSSHVIVLTSRGFVYSWGNGAQGQLGRPGRKLGLVPPKVAELQDIVDIGAGAHHNSAIDRTGQVWSWGLNSSGQIGLAEGRGVEDDTVMLPAVVQDLKKYGGITKIVGGSQHTLAVTEDGECLAWGRLQAFATRLDLVDLDDEYVSWDAEERSRILKPAQVPDVDAALVAAGSDHSIAITADNKVYSWGLNSNGQTGQGRANGESIEVATPLVHNSIDGKKIVWAGAGGNYTMLGELVEELDREADESS